MIEREVTHVKKDERKVITALCNKNYGITWSPRLKDDAVRDILREDASYYVKDNVYPYKIMVQAIKRNDGTYYLKTKKDGKETNNLDNLPEC